MFYRLGMAYKYYVDREMELRSKSNEEYQQRYWSTFTEYYRTKAKENYDTEFYRTFDQLLGRAVAERGVSICLDVGCGGFTQILRLKRKFPDLHFIGNDISTYAAAAYASLEGVGGIRFVPGSILSHAHLFEEIDLFYTFGVLQYLNGAELEQFFATLRRASRSLAGIIVEIYDDGNEALSVTRGRHFLHNYLRYLERFGFDVLAHSSRDHYAMAGERVLFAYFVTGPSSMSEAELGTGRTANRVNRQAVARERG